MCTWQSNMGLMEPSPVHKNGGRLDTDLPIDLYVQRDPMLQITLKKLQMILIMKHKRRTQNQTKTK